jgi:hypothetical protein
MKEKSGEIHFHMVRPKYSSNVGPYTLSLEHIMHWSENEGMFLNPTIVIVSQETVSLEHKYGSLTLHA